MYFEAFSSFSRFCGATFLPPAVTRMSFLRSVIVMKPSSSISAMSPVLQPPVGVEHLAGRLLVLVVAGEDRLAADQQLPVVGQPHLEARQRRPDGAEPVAVGPVHGARRRALGQPVALEDEDVEGVEELDDLAGERRPARVRDAQPAAEPLLDLRVDEAVGDTVPRGQRPGERARPPAGGTLASRPTRSAQRESAPLTPRASSSRASDAPRGSSRRRAGRSGRSSGARRQALRRPAADRGRTRACSPT